MSGFGDALENTSGYREFDPVKPKTKAQRECVDFLGVFSKKVMPSAVRVVERNGHLLFIRHYGFGEDVSQAHDRIWRLLSRFGDSPDAPGSVTVVCLWGIAATSQLLGTERRIRVYDWTGMAESDSSDGAIKAALDKWWKDAEHRPA